MATLVWFLQLPSRSVACETHLFRSQAAAEGKVATGESALREGSLCSLETCALMLITIKLDDLRRRILQYGSSLAAITRLQDTCTHEVDSSPRLLLAEFERNITAVINRRPQPGGLGAQGTRVLDKIFDPSLILPDQQGISAPTTRTTDTIPKAVRISGVADVMIESQGESPQLQGALLRLRLQSPSIAFHNSIDSLPQLNLRRP